MAFLHPDESFISFERLYEMTHGGHLENVIRQFDTCAERIEYVQDFLIDNFNYDCSDYLSQILTLDALTLNDDRHFNNLGIIIDNNTGICRTAPIFDNGAAFLSDYEKFDLIDSIEENIKKVYARPFSANHLRQALDAEIGLKLDYDKLYSLLANEPHTRGLDVLYYQLDRLRTIIPDIHNQI